MQARGNMYLCFTYLSFMYLCFMWQHVRMCALFCGVWAAWAWVE